MLNESDGRLLARFANERDESAFATLVERHGPLVLRVALRMLRRREDAEDAFQAVFMVLARRAASRWEGTTIAGWLHGVTVRVCLNQRKMERRRRQRMEELARSVKERNDMDGPDAMRWMIDEQLADLPQRFREVIVLCDLEGMAQQEVAKQLAVPLGTVSSRLARGREQLRKRLARQGVCVAALGTAATFACLAEAATKLPENLLQSTVRQADAFVWGTTAARAALSLQTKTLAEGALRAMMITRVQTIVCFVGIVAVAAFAGEQAPSFFPNTLSTASAGTFFLDDFSDGSVIDANPVTWRLLPGYDNGALDASAGDLRVTNTGDASVVVVAGEVGSHAYGDVSVRTRLRSSNGPEGVFASVFARLDATALKAYQLGIEDNGFLSIVYNDPAVSILKGVPTPLRPHQEDVMLQFDLVGNELRAYAWRASEPRPMQPTAFVTDARLTAGQVGVSDAFGQNATTFRFFQATEVPEPASGALCAVGSAFLAIGLLFSRRHRRTRFGR